MKKFLSVLLTLALLCALLAACGGKEDLPTTTILTETGEQVELPLVTVLIDAPSIQLTNFMSIMRTVPGYDREFHLEVTQLPQEPERSQQLQRIRTEILAGKGPDVFISDCYTPTLVDLRDVGLDLGDGPLFNFPTQAMKNRVFLPLDEYIENAQFMEFDQLNPTIMALGRNEEGQQILPMEFNFWVTGYIPSGYDMPQERPQSLEKMWDSGCPVLEFTANGMWGDSLLDSFAQTIDQENDLPAFTEEALLEHALAVWESWQKLKQEEWDFLSEEMWDGCAPMSHFIEEFHPKQDTILTPCYNDAGGISAYVTLFSAINRNASYPEFSFRVLDKLLSKAVMSEQVIYGWTAGMPTFTGGDGEMPALGGSSLTPELLEQYQELLGMVNGVRFLTTLDQEILRALLPVCSDENATQQDVEKTVHQLYTTFKMMLAES